MGKGQELRGKVDDFSFTTLSEVKGLLEERHLLSSEWAEILENVKTGCEDLFYRIPLD